MMTDETMALTQLLAEAREYSSITFRQAEYLQRHNVGVGKDFPEIPERIKQEMRKLEDLVRRVEQNHLADNLTAPPDVQCLVLEATTLMKELRQYWRHPQISDED